MPHSPRWPRGPSRKQDNPDHLGPLYPERRTKSQRVQNMDLGERIRARRVSMPPIFPQDLRDLDVRCRCGHLCFIHASYDLTYAVEEEAYPRDRTPPGTCHYNGCLCTHPVEDPALLMSGPPRRRLPDPPEPPTSPESKHRLKVWKSWE